MSTAADAYNAQVSADAAQRLLEGCASKYGDGLAPPPLGLVVGLAAVAVCERLNALTLRHAHEMQVAHASE